MLSLDYAAACSPLGLHPQLLLAQTVKTSLVASHWPLVKICARLLGLDTKWFFIFNIYFVGICSLRAEKYFKCLYFNCDNCFVKTYIKAYIVACKLHSCILACQLLLELLLAVAAVLPAAVTTSITIHKELSLDLWNVPRCSILFDCVSCSYCLYLWL